MQQALERQIVFEDHKEAYALLGDRDEFLQVLRENFDCQFISRGEQLEILGEAAEVKMAATLVEELQYLYRQGTTITMHEVRYGIGLVRGGKGEALHTLFGDTILVTSRGRHVRPKTLGQRRYLDTIRHNSITFGIGPAGTGKTYLAVDASISLSRLCSRLIHSHLSCQLYQTLSSVSYAPFPQNSPPDISGCTRLWPLMSDASVQFHPSIYHTFS